MKKSKKHVDVNGRSISVYDGMFTHQEIEQIYADVVVRPYRKHNADNLFYNPAKHVDMKWASELLVGEHLHEKIMPRYLNDIHEIKDRRINITRQYVNCSSYDTIDYIHEDAQYDEDNAYTVLQYANHMWNKNWFGETAFFDNDHEDIVYSSVIKPGRVVVFNSSIPHTARTQSKISEFSRYVIVTKLQLIDNKD